MNRFTSVARVVLGLTLVVFGFDGVVHFFPLPPMPEPAARVIDTLIGYRLFYVVKAIEISAGVLLLTNRFVVLALCALAPVLFNIVWFDANLDPASLPVAVVLCALAGWLGWAHRARFVPLLQARA
jgi:putative oxidoreductase